MEGFFVPNIILERAAYFRCFMEQMNLPKGTLPFLSSPHKDMAMSWYSPILSVK